MSPILTPATPEELADLVRSTPRVLPVGAGTKPRLSRAPEGCVALSLRGLTGIVEYEPDEFTFTARAGTPLTTIAAALAERGQYLPFDPPLVAAGATLGGTVAAGLNGAGRFRFGGVRDFILGVRFVDGDGRLLQMGGKVVKNAAGFDLPKFFVGSAGRFGALAEITLKVFPRSPASRTLRIPCAGLPALVRTLSEIATAAWEPDALEASPEDCAILVRLAGPAAALDGLSHAVMSRFGGELLAEDAAERSWAGLAEFRWAFAAGTLLKIPLTPRQIPGLLEAIRPLAEARIRLGNGGNVAWISFAGAQVPPALDAVLRQLGLPALTLRGEGPLRPGARPRPAIAAAVKRALDPQHRFPGLDD